MRKFLNFRNEKKYVEDIGNVVFSTCETGQVWHEVSAELKGSRVIMIVDNQVVAVTDEPSQVSPLENSSIFECSEFKVGDYVYFDGEKLIAIEAPPNQLYTKFNGKSWETEKTLDEQLEYYQYLLVSKKMELTNLKNAGFGNTKLEEEIKKLENQHFNTSFEIAISQNF